MAHSNAKTIKYLSFFVALVILAVAL